MKKTVRRKVLGKSMLQVCCTSSPSPPAKMKVFDLGGSWTAPIGFLVSEHTFPQAAYRHRAPLFGLRRTPRQRRAATTGKNPALVGHRTPTKANRGREREKQNP